MLTILQGDCVERLGEIPNESIQCCVTSPPYWGLRDYGTATWEGGDKECDHVATQIRIGINLRESVHSTRGGALKAKEITGIPFRDVCGKCGAKRIDSQLGLEKTPEEYVAKMVAVFREVWRVLKNDGTLWLNLGDSYAAAPTGSFNGGGFKDVSARNGTRDLSGVEQSGALDKTRGTGLKPKDLCGIPWMVAFALRAAGAASPAHMRDVDRMISAITASYDSRSEWPSRIRSEVERLEAEHIEANRGGWYLRSDIIWAKPNPMPESVTDRPTKSHEYLFLLTKFSRYFYDAEAIKEKSVEANWQSRLSRESDKSQPTEKVNGIRVRKPAGWATHEGSHSSIHREGREQEVTYGEIPDDRNKRTVWTVTTQGFGLELCQNCDRIYDRKEYKRLGTYTNDEDKEFRICFCGRWDRWLSHFATYPPDLIKPCILAGSRPGDTILDPFAGSGTTGMVALELGRKAVLIELNPAYVKLIEQRCDITPGLALHSEAAA